MIMMVYIRNIELFNTPESIFIEQETKVRKRRETTFINSFCGTPFSSIFKNLYFLNKKRYLEKICLITGLAMAFYILEKPYPYISYHPIG